MVTVLGVPLDVGMSLVVSKVVMVTSDVVLCPVTLPVPLGSRVCGEVGGGSGRFVCVVCTTILVDMGMIM